MHLRPPRILTIIILLLATSLLLTICTTTQPPHHPQHITITLERTPCFGRCPVYKVTLDETGAVTYTGTRHVATTGTHTTTIPRAKFRSLINQAQSLDFWSMSDKYDGSWGVHVTDVPSTIITITLDNQTKKVTDRYQPPANLQTLEHLIDDTANTKQWISPPATTTEGNP